MDYSALLPLLVIVAAAVVSNLYRKRRADDRGQAVSTIASKSGWRYYDAEPALGDRWPGDPFGRGDHRDVANVIRGSWGARKFIAFDYSYETRQGLFPQARGAGWVNRFGVVVMQLPGSLPYLQVQHENLLGEKVADLLTGEQDIAFESEEFNRLFRITADDTWYARAVIHPRMMNLLMDRGELGWRLSGGDLIGWHRGHHTEEELRRRLDFLATLIEEIPRDQYAG
ncbi:hypothetical protein [Kribbella catacumbae]|uniref:hypothetical protein n=1 Tax=Kribbella catacumbae TaxID=460086 RepID=UPI000367EAFE|nr:hypothetical protein [Kribbella catacumbae]